ncbi:class I SAM-dependent methyltransferase [Altererythrobacter arenosus]|uniref:Class I SAM-dependent methyltransferase n=1 Tax=Altererythrobacter arenosus TaxID=3032592 RepID=A0ABY8FV53_9SPHN|nr:class I SAM-dependent methyltransferase [Altererythrobacter sp. CAU 1644]WFL78885.1 class I SAM-dependent methyltransferase [Altererythrobacter sp. CAU 1644]
MPLLPEFFAGRTPPDLYHEYLSPAFEPWANALLESLPPQGLVLDIACGTGLVSRKVAEDGAVDAIKAIDVAPPMISKAEGLGLGRGSKIEYSMASADDLPFRDGEFECAYCQQGLQFFPDRLAAMKEIRRVLGSGAKAAISTWTFAADGNPVFDAFEQIIAEELGPDLLPFGPFSFGNRWEIEDLASDAGFKVVSLEKESRLSPLPDVRTFVLFDISFLGRPAADGTLQPILDFADPANDTIIERLIARVSDATAPFRQTDGALLAPMTAHVLIAEA